MSIEIVAYDFMTEEECLYETAKRLTPMGQPLTIQAKEAWAKWEEMTRKWEHKETNIKGLKS